MRPSILIFAICAAAGCADASFVIANRSDFEIHELYVAHIEDPSWGANLLDTVLRPGDSFSVDVCCGTYDAMLVDETGAICEVSAVELCFETDDWVIRNATCRVYDAR